MPINNALLTIGADAMSDAVTHLSLHSSTPDGSGSNETSAGREAVVWVVDGPDATATNIPFEGGASSGAVAAVGFWSAASGGTFYGYAVLSGGSDATFNAAGEYTVTSVALTGTAT